MYLTLDSINDFNRYKLVEISKNMQNKLEKEKNSVLIKILVFVLAVELLKERYYKLSIFILLRKGRNNFHHINFYYVQKEIDRVINSVNNKIKYCDMSIEYDYSFQKELARQINALMNLNSYIDRIHRLKTNRNLQNESITLKHNQTSAYTLLQRVRVLEISIVKLILSKGRSRIHARFTRQHHEYFIDENEIFLVSRIKRACVSLCRRVIHLSSTANKILMGMTLSIPTYVAIFVLIGNIVSSEIPKFARLISEDINFTPLTSQNDGKTEIYVSDRLREFDKRDEAKTKNLLLRITSISTLAIAAGSLGSIISILTRINQYKDEEKNFEGNALPFTIGFVKPLIGGSVGLFIFCAYSSSFFHGNEFFSRSTTISEQTQNEAHPLQDDDINIKYLFDVFVIAFVAGFSERWVKDIISQVNK